MIVLYHLFVQTNIEVTMMYIIPQEREEEKVAICCHLLRSSLSQRRTGKITDEKNYQFLGTFSFPSQNMLWYVEDISKLPHYTASDPHFLWSDVQFSKTGLTKQLIEVKNDREVQKLWFHRAQCKGAKKM